MPTFVDRNLQGMPGLNIRSSAGVIRFETPDLAWTTTAGHRVLFANAANNLIWDNGTTQITLASATGVATTFEQIFANDTTLAMTATGLTMSQTADAMVLTLTKTGTGAGSPLVINNAGTGDDISVVVTEAGTTGVVIDFHHDSGTPADNDVICALEFNADDDGGAKTEFGRFRVLATDVTDATEDASMEWAMFVAGTERTCLTLTGPTMTVGDGASNATITTSGALDLILSTNAGTDSGTIRIYDAAGGNIEILPNGTGDLTVPTSGIVLGGTTPTRCTFAVAGTTGDGFAITTSTITSGDVLSVDHTANATLAGGNLLNLLVDSVSVFSVGENGVTTIVGVAGSNVLSITAGDIVGSDTSLTLTDADNAATFSVTNNTVTSATAITFAGSGVFTGTTTTSFFTVLHTGGTAGTTAYFSSSTATSSVAVVDISAAALTSGSALRITPGSATFTTGGRCIELEGGSAVAGNYLTATTTGAYTGTGMVLLTAGAATTGILLSLVSTTGMTSGSLFRGTTSTAGVLATNGVFSFRGTGAFTSTSNTGLVDIRASAMVGTAANATLVNIMATAAAQVDTTLLNVEASGFTTGYTGTMVRIVSPTTTGSGTIVSVVGNGITSGGTAASISTTALTTGIACSITASGGTAAITTGSLLRVATDGTGAIATNGVVSFTHTGIYTSTSATDGGFVEVKANSTTAGTVINVLGTALTTGIGMHISNGTAATTTGSLLRVTAGGVGAVATNGIVSFVHTGVYTSTTVGFLNVSASGTTGGTVATITGAAVTDGVGLQVSNASITTGAHFRILGAAGATMFNIGVNGATTIAGSAGLTAALTITAGDLVMSAGVFRGAVSAAVTADVGSVQGGSPITRSFVEISVCANAGDAVTLPAAALGQFVVITNHGANAADVFPASGDAINEAAVDTATSIAVNETFICWAYDTTNWEVVQLARNS